MWASIFTGQFAFFLGLAVAFAQDGNANAPFCGLVALCTLGIAIVFTWRLS